MAHLVNAISEDRFAQLSSKLAKLSFFLYVFFLFFRTSMPFQEEITRADDIVTSSLFNQLLFSSLYLIAIIGLLSKRQVIFDFVKREKFLSLFLVWTFLTVFWSDYPTVSLKRWFRLLGMIIVFLSGLLHMESTDEAVDYFKIVLSIYLPLTLLSILFVPGATQWEFPAWRGLAPHKNMLGQFSLISLIIWTYAVREQSVKKKTVAILFLILSFVFLVGSKSTTSYFTFALLVFVAGLVLSEKLLASPVKGLFSLIVVLSCLGIFFSILYLAPDLLESLLGTFGKDSTFTGRTDLWESVFELTKKRLFFGYGFGGFWVANSPMLEKIFAEQMWFPNQSHLGYLDILTETGLVGFILFTSMVVYCFKNVLMLKTTHLWKWFVIAALIMNLSESTLFKVSELTGDLFVLSYLAIHVEILNENNEFVASLFHVENE
jgi:exopolysaccharide production protein ExoQ